MSLFESVFLPKRFSFQFVLGCIDADFCDQIRAVDEIYKFHSPRDHKFRIFANVRQSIFQNLPNLSIEFKA